MCVRTTTTATSFICNDEYDVPPPPWHLHQPMTDSADWQQQTTMRHGWHVTTPQFIPLPQMIALTCQVTAGLSFFGYFLYTLLMLFQKWTWTMTKNGDDKGKRWVRYVFLWTFFFSTKWLFTVWSAITVMGKTVYFLFTELNLVYIYISSCI